MMNLRIRNFAKISKADIEIDGITIIAGNNNTGKSTVGKILDSVFNSSYNIDEKMNKARIDSLASMLRNEIEGSMARVNRSVRRYLPRTYRGFAKDLLECKEDEREELCKENKNVVL